MNGKIQTGRAVLPRGLGFGRRGSAAPLFLTTLFLLLAVDAMAETTNDSVGAIIQGRMLALHLLEQRPTESFIQTGVLKIRDAEGHSSEIPVRCEVLVTPTNWQSIYKAIYTNNPETLTVTHSSFQTGQPEGDFNSNNYFPAVGSSNIQLGPPNSYAYTGHLVQQGSATNEWKTQIKNHLTPFAGSDFWQCDLGLEFFHWPAQKILPKTTNLKRGREYTLLESTNPNPSTNGYSRVLSWIDKESGGILEAEAYDLNGKLLKDFAPKSFKKVNGQWELQEMEIRNVQTGSRTRLEFNLKK